MIDLRYESGMSVEFKPPMLKLTRRQNYHDPQNRHVFQRQAPRGLNQDGVEVMSFERTMLIYKRGHSPEDAANY
jgi:hypothetical protein